MLKRFGVNARTNLKVLETFTYNFTEVHHLEELSKKLECLIKEYQCHLPRFDCLILRHRAQQRAKQIKRKYLVPPLLLQETERRLTGISETELVKKQMLLGRRRYTNIIS